MLCFFLLGELCGGEVGDPAPRLHCSLNMNERK